MTRTSLIIATLVLVAGAARADDTGASNVQATVSGYMELTAAGPARLIGAVGGSITGNKAAGQRLSGMSIQLGEIGPGNNNPFVKVLVPLQIRTNAGYSLSLSATQIPSSGDKISSADIGFGVDRPQRGTDTVRGTDVVAIAEGDPTLESDADANTARWDYRKGKRLSDYASPTEVLRGPRVMLPVPAGSGGGVRTTLYFCVKPQFFAAGSFSTSLTLTLSSP